MGALSRMGKRARERRTPWKGERWITGESYQELVKKYLTVGNLRGGISRKTIFFSIVIETQSDSKSTFLVRASFLQIYNEKIMDLLVRSLVDA